ASGLLARMNSSVLANDCTLSATERMRLCSASRTDGSSSMTKTVGRSLGRACSIMTAIRPGRHRELEYRAARQICCRPYPASVSFDDRPADRQPHPHPARFRTIESIEEAVDVSRQGAGANILDRRRHIRAIAPGAHDDVAR